MTDTSDIPRKSIRVHYPTIGAKWIYPNDKMWAEKKELIKRIWIVGETEIKIDNCFAQSKNFQEFRHCYLTRPIRFQDIMSGKNIKMEQVV